MFCRMHCNPNLVLLAIARLAEFDWDATSVEWFALEYERSKFIFIAAVLVVMCKPAEERKLPRVVMIRSICFIVRSLPIVLCLEILLRGLKLVVREGWRLFGISDVGETKWRERLSE